VGFAQSRSPTAIKFGPSRTKILQKEENKKLSVYPDEIINVGNHSSSTHSHSTYQHGFPFLIPLPQR